MLISQTMTVHSVFVMSEKTLVRLASHPSLFRKATIIFHSCSHPASLDGCFWCEGKGYQGGRSSPGFMKVPSDLMDEIRRYTGDRTRGLVIEFTKRQSNNVRKKYVKLAGVEDWGLVSNHRFRAFGITQAYRKTKDPMATRDMARHKNIQTTNDYIAVVEAEEQDKIVDQLAKELL